MCVPEENRHKVETILHSFESWQLPKWVKSYFNEKIQAYDVVILVILWRIQKGNMYNVFKEIEPMWYNTGRQVMLYAGRVRNILSYISEEDLSPCNDLIKSYIYFTVYGIVRFHFIWHQCMRISLYCIRHSWYRHRAVQLLWAYNETCDSLIQNNSNSSSKEEVLRDPISSEKTNYHKHTKKHYKEHSAT